MSMAKLVARAILGLIFIVVSAMTYYALTDDNNESNDIGILSKHGALSAGSKDKHKHHQEWPDRLTHKPPEMIHVAYPVEKVAGLQEVKKVEPKISVNVSGYSNLTSANMVNKTSSDPVENFDPGNIILGDEHGVFQMPHIPGQNIISMTLYGSSTRYTMGAIRNAELIKTNFPGWQLRIYTETPTTSRYGAIPQNVMSSLRALGADFYFMQPREDFIPPMMWRFLVADDTWVDRFIVRDSDARLTQRDAAAVYAWIKSDKPFTCIRDHPSHAAYAISGGLWGAKPQELRNILRKSWKDLMRGVPSHYLEDMMFLDKVLWPKVKNHAYCSDSVSCTEWPGAHPFPVPRFGYEHVGQVVNEHDLGRPVDLQLLRKAGENKNCTPPSNSMLPNQSHNKR